ncbi:hypothetical protein MLD38_005908 [Melastoma candidum]|uniref:Uncharacterized protein n=1 Tax=Melastoma candidum TaxID=119954 RepID=A0ACB9RL79_9MYRT|nr:hypothetical protein MLD38_005908 [Melastoma candidum]
MASRAGFDPTATFHPIPTTTTFHPILAFPSLSNTNATPSIALPVDPSLSQVSGAAAVTPFGSSLVAPLSPITNIVTVKLSTENYPVWLSLVTSYLHSANLMQYDDGTILQPLSELQTVVGIMVPKPVGHIAANKLAPRFAPCIFLGYSDKHKGYRCFDAAFDRIHYSRHVHFVEDTFSASTLLQHSSLSTRNPTNSYQEVTWFLPTMPRQPPPSSAVIDSVFAASTSTVTAPLPCSIPPHSSGVLFEPSTPFVNQVVDLLLSRYALKVAPQLRSLLRMSIYPLHCPNIL